MTRPRSWKVAGPIPWTFLWGDHHLLGSKDKKTGGRRIDVRFSSFSNIKRFNLAVFFGGEGLINLLFIFIDVFLGAVMSS